ncbi:MAG: hypothetical protein AAF789_10055, partial [Bacteroidota bacterium]
MILELTIRIHEKWKQMLTLKTNLTDIYSVNRNLFAIVLVLFYGYLGTAQTLLSKVDSHWKWVLNEEEFELKGVTLGFEPTAQDFDQRMRELRSMGVNAIRLWGTNEQTIQILDVAEKYHLKVMVGIWMRHGRPGMEADDRFNYLTDTKGMQAMFDNAIQIVEKFKDPVILVSLMMAFAFIGGWMGGSGALTV